MLFLLCLPVTSFGYTNDEMTLQMLNSQIEKLTQERDKKYEELKQCEKTTKGFKIAGITTLVATGFGIYGNIKLAQKLRDGTSSGRGRGNIPTDNRSEEQKANSECAMFCAEFPEDAADIGCEC